MTTDDDLRGDESTENPDVPEGSEEMIDEDAIERFGRDLDEAEVAARALEERREQPRTAEPPQHPAVPAEPF